MSKLLVEGVPLFVIKRGIVYCTTDIDGETTTLCMHVSDFRLAMVNANRALDEWAEKDRGRVVSIKRKR